MDNFIFQNPVKLIMGRGMISRLSEEIPADKRVMITTTISASVIIIPTEIA